MTYFWWEIVSNCIRDTRERFPAAGGSRIIMIVDIMKYPSFNILGIQVIL